MKKMKMFVVMGVMLVAASSYGDMTALLAPGDAILAIDADGMVSNSSYPAAESPSKALDGLSNTKYLNFGRENSGFIVTSAAAGATILQSFTLTTANDWAQRDPLSWALWGTNDAIVSTDNSIGAAESWTLIGEGTVALPDARFTVGPVVSVANSTAYTSYKMMYPTLKDAGATNSMQVADVSFFQSSDGSGPSFLAASDPILAIHAGPDSSYPGAENPANAIDGDGMGTKYLNFGGVNSGLIVTPSSGLTLVKGFQITTGNDAPERDPASWELYGTNEVIASTDNSDGLAEIWTLIDSGTITLPDGRNVLGDMVAVDNSQVFASYKMVFPNLKDNNSIMQISEIQFFGVPEPLTLSLLGLGALVLRRRS